MLDQLDLRLYAILDPEHSGGHALPDLARKLAAGGTTLVQLRDKKGDPRSQIVLARAVKAALGEVPLIINDHIDVAIEAGADGVHLGQEDLDVATARARLGPVPFIGLTIKTQAQAWAAPLRLIDYVGIGGVFGTASKNNPDPPIGLEGLRAIVRIFRYRMGNFPMCAIAGINTSNAGDVISAGVDGVSVISALSLAPDPTAAACALRAVVDAALTRCAPKVPAVGAAGH
jgi:thiamine-phosphate pyrophosphorylase